jgi:hypothetical protein
VTGTLLLEGRKHFGSAARAKRDGAQTEFDSAHGLPPPEAHAAAPTGDIVDELNGVKDSAWREPFGATAAAQETHWASYSQQR